MNPVTAQLLDAARAALAQHEWFEAHERFEELWLELTDRSDRDVAQGLAQMAAVAHHLATGNVAAAGRLAPRAQALLAAEAEWRGVALAPLAAWLREVRESLARGAGAELLPPPL